MVARRKCCDTFVNEFHTENCFHKEDEDEINHPSYYGGDEVYEVIKIIHAHRLNFNKGCAVKYILRAGIKDPNTTVQDLKKAIFYLNYEIELLEGTREV